MGEWGRRGAWERVRAGERAGRQRGRLAHKWAGGAGWSAGEQAPASPLSDSCVRAPMWAADDPQDAVVAKQYKSDKTQFDSTAKFWTETYAKPKDEDAAIKKLMEMGFEEAQCKKALAEAGGDENAALDKLLSSI